MKRSRRKLNIKRIGMPEPIDKLLSGGIELGTITQIFGPPGVGKTNLCLLSTVNCVATGKKVIFIDTEGGLSVERLRQISGDAFNNVLEDLLVYEPKDFAEQDKTITGLGEIADQGVGLIILDSAATLYRIERNDDNASEINQAFGRQFSRLSRIARDKDIAVMITNQVYPSFDGDGVEVVGKDISRYWSKAILELRHGERGTKEAILRRHRSMPEGLKSKFRITESGIGIAE